MRYLALDYSSTSCGWCIYDTDFDAFTSGTIRPNGDFNTRVNEIRDELYGICIRGIDRVYIEDIYGGFPGTVKKLIASAYFTCSGIVESFEDIITVNASTWRKNAYGRHPKDKNLVKQLAIDTCESFGHSVDSADEAEAVMIMKACIKMHELERR